MTQSTEQNKRHTAFVLVSSIALGVAAVYIFSNGKNISIPAELVDTFVSDWGYSPNNGPNMWASLSGLNRVCSRGVLQSPIDIRTADISSKIKGLPPLSWNFTDVPGTATENFDGRAFYFTFSGSPPQITTLDFSKYLDAVPLSAVATTTYSLIKVVLHTPSENLLEGSQYVPFI